MFGKKRLHEDDNQMSSTYQPRSTDHKLGFNKRLKISTPHEQKYAFFKKRSLSQTTNTTLFNNNTDKPDDIDNGVEEQEKMKSPVRKRPRNNLDLYCKIDIDQLDFSRFHISNFAHDFWDLAPHMLPYLLFPHINLATLWTLLSVNRKCRKAVRLYEQQFFPIINNVFNKYRYDDLLPKTCSCDQCRWEAMRCWFWKVVHTLYDPSKSTWNRAVAQIGGPIGRQLLRNYQRAEQARRYTNIELKLPFRSPHKYNSFLSYV